VLANEATGVALIVVDPKGENQIAVGAGANAAVSPEQVSLALKGCGGNTGCVLVSTEIPEAAVMAAVEAAASAGVRCILNPAPVVPAVLRLLRHGPLLTPNATELVALVAGLEQGPSAAAASGDGALGNFEKIADGARQLVAQTQAPVVVTIGGDGALIVTPDGRTEHVPALPVYVRDTTGAGDTFNGVLATRLASGDEPGVAVRVAVVAASLSVAHVGARAGMPSAERIAAELSPA
jgi:ribokinase